MPIRVLITDNDLGDSRLEHDILARDIGADVVVASCVTEGDVIEAVRSTEPDAIIVQWAPITRAVLDAAHRCKVISRIGIGVDMIDLAAAEALGVHVLNVPDYCTEEVATHAVSLAMSLWRRLPQLDAEVRSGTWNAAAWAGRIGRLSEATVGLIGLGRIGTMVADAFAGWGSRIIVADPLFGNDMYPRVSVDELVAEADIISLHAPLTQATHHIIGPARVERMHRRPIIVNTSRGALIDDVALCQGLASGQIAAAGLDVFELEPIALNDPLHSFPNVVLTPHASWCSGAALPELRRGAAMNIVRFFST